MNKFYTILKRFIDMSKGLANSSIKYSKDLLRRKKTIDNDYTRINRINRIKIREIKDLETYLKNIQNTNLQLEKDISTMKNSITEKEALIKTLQHLIAKRFNW